MSQKIRIHITKNGDTAFNQKRVVVLNPKTDLNKKKLLALAKNKLQMKANRIFLVRDQHNETIYGKEIVESSEDTSSETLSCAQVAEDDILVFSKDKDFITDEQQRQKFEQKIETDAARRESGHGDIVVKVIAKHAWLEDEAVKQLERVSKTLPGVCAAVGLPDLHPGKGFPIGAAIMTVDIVYPTLVGSDCGCGVSLFQTPITTTSKALTKLEKLADKIHGLETPWPGDVTEWLAKFEVFESSPFDQSTIGSIGSGNHFCELVKVVEVKDEHVFTEELGLDASRCQLLVHSGSRGLGRSLLQDHENQFGTSGLRFDSEEGRIYLDRHEHACRWARSNRHLIAKRFMDCLDSNAECVVDLFHNNVEKEVVNGQIMWIHRKGAAPANKGCVVLPGSRGAYTYLIKPVSDPDVMEACAYSVAHGAGRRHTRSKARALMKNDPRKTADALRTTPLGSYVVCDDKDLLYEENPDAYKDIDAVIRDLEEFGIAKVIAIFTPLITYKTRARVHQSED